VRAALGKRQRRHIYLIFKEAINNIARHSECRKVALEMRISNDLLIGFISDMGVGLLSSLMESFLPMREEGTD